MPTLRQTIALYAVLTALVLLLAACTTAGDVAVHSPTPPVPPAGDFPTAEPLTLPRIPHAVAGFDDCLICHSPQGTQPIPANHALYTVDRCLHCHRPAIEVTPTITPTPQPMPHPLVGRKDCSLCHAPQRLEMPSDHYTMDLDKCTECHTPPDVTPTPTVQSP